MATKVTESPAATSFTKQQIISAKRYAERRDLLNVLLADDGSYTHDQVEKLMDEFMKKGVK
ncbi:hypothetical protein [Sporomusa acidovorans]|uniref:Uncharacterized protein n=1 Tax=Sporomusa acidovorans (strain ATCC 49682 / DSM 3132 / Mol) TaxID=1123286 RepID=A0ABZ3J797_SPOA4|nr:hypothetical protein [Sporomusa acidovorans]OZC23812.1 hypothetical protein SPACI_04370 [Sporomusa acidovorans DSM 3132]SDF61883.1 hypothetical protein SAMN04488499_106317 [Sporomusa acidovorans]